MDNLDKRVKSPLGLAKRVFYKLLLGPLKYGRKNYKADQYWKDRFAKYGTSILGAGDEGLSESENQKMYAKAGQVFLELCASQNIDIKNCDALEIGCGTGFYTAILASEGVRSYRAADITDVLFAEHQNKFPDFVFDKIDVSAEELNGQYDLIIMIDVIQHITEPAKFRKAMDNVYRCLKPNGHFILTPIESETKKLFFYLACWTLEDILKSFPHCQVSEPLAFRTSEIRAIHKL
jgi:2-polyprenyl-3-methyl-5-hydroxy-6-metoxy-1,4-benzoquinol methylase